jgi:integrase/recombinase XerD
MKGLPPSADRAELERIWRSYAPPAPDWEDLEDPVALAQRYVDLKMYAGYRFNSQGRIVLDFARFLKEKGMSRMGEVPADLILAYFDRYTRASTNTWSNHLITISNWMDHLRSIGKLTRNPCVLLWRTKQEYVPHIFTPDQLRRIVRPEADACESRRNRSVAYHLIYALGLRVSEATSLRIRDIDWNERTALIRQSKFGKSRLVPAHPKVLERLEGLLDARGGRGALKPDECVLTHRRGWQRGKPWSSKMLSSDFRNDLRALGIFRPRRVVGKVRYGSSSIHGLRHSMAVHRLLRWYREGADVQAKLPLLATFLGHSSYEHTQVYRALPVAVRSTDFE